MEPVHQQTGNPVGTLTVSRYEWRSVLAGAYANDKAMSRMVAHLVDVNTEAVLCKKIKPERMSDIGSLDNTPHCPECERRFAKLSSKKPAGRAKLKRRSAKRVKSRRRRRLLGRVQRARKRLAQRKRSKILVHDTGSRSGIVTKCQNCGGVARFRAKLPAANDSGTWAALADEHEDDCEWIKTRGYQRHQGN